MKDLDAFLDLLPVNVGYNALIAAGLACLMGGAAVWFTALETEKVSKLHSDLINVEALQPPVPVLKYVTVDSTALQPLLKKISETYKGISMSGGGEAGVTITAQDTDYFPQFLAAISYLQRGGKNWKVKINTLCVGRECTSSKLSATLKIELVRFGEPEIKKADEEEKKE